MALWVWLCYSYFSVGVALCAVLFQCGVCDLAVLFQCARVYLKENVVLLNGSEEEVKQQREAMGHRREETKQAKMAAKVCMYNQPMRDDPSIITSTVGLVESDHPIVRTPLYQDHLVVSILDLQFLAAPGVMPGGG